jgi:hypothetical protein
LKKRKVDPWIQTYTGKQFWFNNPENISIYDIAHSLSNQCRFAGHTKKFYSVAEHSVLVSSILPGELKLPGLLHDAAEAYIQDITKPLKNFLGSGPYDDAEKRINAAISRKFGLVGTQSYDIHIADLVLLRIEAQQALLHEPIDGWHLNLPYLFSGEAIRIEFLTPEDAEELFLKTFYELTENGGGCYAI